MNHKLLSTAGLFLTASLLSPTIMAIGGTGLDADGAEGKGYVGVGAGFIPDYEGSDDYKAVPVIGARYTWASGRFAKLGGAGGVEQAARLSLNLVDQRVTSTWTIGPLLQYRLKRDGSDLDDSRVKKMQDVDAQTEAGAFIGWHKDRVNVEVAFSSDISDKSNGSLGYLSGDYKIPYGAKTTFILGAHLTYASSNFMDEYFGVNKKDAARSGLKRYRADSGLKDTGLKAGMLYSFNPTWSMFASMGYTRMLGDAEDSPLVDDRGDKNQLSGALAAVYMF